MENKYQKALDNIREDLKTLAKAKYYGGTHLATLQELVDKETPKEVINTGTEIFCPRCSKMFNFVIGGNGLCVTIPQYCSDCGQKLGSDTDE